MDPKKYRSIVKKCRKSAKTSKRNASQGMAPLLYVGLGLFGLGLVGALLTTVKAVQPIAIAIAILGIIGGFACTLSAVVPGASKRELVFLEDRLLLRKGEQQIIGQIPYANVATVDLVFRVDDDNGMEYSLLEVTLYKPRDAETWWPRRVRGKDFDLEIANDYPYPLTTIRHEILDGVQRHLEKRTGQRREGPPLAGY